MSTPLNLDLDFLDYTPPTAEAASERVDFNSSRHRDDRSGFQINIPTETKQHQQPQASNQTASSLFQNLISNATKFGSQSGMSEDALRQMVLASNRHKQQQKLTSSGSSFNWGLNYLAEYFDVTTTDVIQRILWSAIPLNRAGPDIDDLEDTDEMMAPLDESSSEREKQCGTRHKPYSYMERFIQSRPDFYGPFWISTTLVFVVAIISNIVGFANYNSRRMEQLALENRLGVKMLAKLNITLERISLNEAEQLDRWHYSMNELNMMSSLVMLYMSLVPTSLWLLFRFRGCDKLYSLTETICACGYSMSVFIPMALMLTIQTPLSRYLIIAQAAGLSSMVLILSFLPVVKSDPNPTGAHLLLVIVPICQFGLAYCIHRITQQP